MVVADDLNRTRVARAVAAAAFTVVVGRIGVETSAAVVGIAFTGFRFGRFFEFSFFQDSGLACLPFRIGRSAIRSAADANQAKRRASEEQETKAKSSFFILHTFLEENMKMLQTLLGRSPLKP